MECMTQNYYPFTHTKNNFVSFQRVNPFSVKILHVISMNILSTKMKNVSCETNTFYSLIRTRTTQCIALLKSRLSIPSLVVFLNYTTQGIVICLESFFKALIKKRISLINKVFL